MKQILQDTELKVGRNRPCPCNSGKKFKKCCGDLSLKKIPIKESVILGDQKLKQYINDNGLSNEMLYHITTPQNWELIKKEGLRGGTYNWGDFDLYGNIYFTNENSVKTWNSISSSQLECDKIVRGKTELDTWINSCRRRDKKPYVVIGVPIEVFNQLELPIHNDTENKEITNLNRNQKFVSLGDDNVYINPILLTKVYEGITDVFQYESEDRWDKVIDFYKEQEPTWSLEQIKENCYIYDYGVVFSYYKDRKTHTSYNRNYMNKVLLNMTLQQMRN